MKILPVSESLQKVRLISRILAFLLLCNMLLPALPGSFPQLPVGQALAEDPEDGEDPNDPGDGPDEYDDDTIPFRLVNVEGKAPGIDQDSEWTLVLKPEWPDQNLVNRVTKVELSLQCMEMDWNHGWSHVYKKKYEGFPAVLTCIGPKIAGQYQVEVTVFYDNSYKIVYSGFTLQGEGKEKIMNVINQAAAGCKVPGNEWQTAFNLYNWLLNHLVYDDTRSFYSSDAILRGTGVCDSYARLYFLLCKAAGLDAFVIYGDTATDYHAWDAVKINGKWYYADPTWDDHPANDPAMNYSHPTTDPNGVVYGVQVYRHFMLNKQLMTLNDHLTYEWLDESKFSCPELPCTSLDANYHVHTGRCDAWGISEGGTFLSIRDLIRNAFAAGEGLWSSRSLSQKVVYAQGFSDPPFRPAKNELILLAYVLKGSTLELANGSTVTLDTYLYESTDNSGTILNVYPEGALATDEAGQFVLPQNLTHIADHAFEGDPHVGIVVCPAGLQSIGSRAFANCERLWSIRIPSSVQSIAADAFEGCSSNFCIRTEHRDSLPARYATEHNIDLFVDDEEQGGNG